MLNAQKNNFRVMTFNVENLFDTIHDKGKNDRAFLPEGANHWTHKRLQKKLYDLADVISEVGGIKFPDIVGLIEIENENVLQQLLQNTGLKNANYQYVITEGDDSRGIDVALLYLPDILKIEKQEEWKVHFTHNPNKHSRNILYVKGTLFNQQELHIMIVHLPSRREGKQKSDPHRKDVIDLLQKKCDSITRVSPQAAIMVMGDFNAEPKDKITLPFAHLLKGRRTIYKAELMYDITSHIAPGKIPGSYYFRGRWEQIDRIIIKGSMLAKKRRKQKIAYKWNSAQAVLIPRHLRKKADGRQIPKRTYGGTTYIGGVSDHLPVVADFILEN